MGEYHSYCTVRGPTLEVIHIHVCILVIKSNFCVLLDRDSFAQLVREVASPDVGKMGIEILSFTIKDIEDKVLYLDSLGKTQTAKVKRDADIGVAEANRDAGIRVSNVHLGLSFVTMIVLRKRERPN